MTAERDYSAELPTEPPDGLAPWVLEQGAMKAELLVYKMASWHNPATDRREKAVQLKCTACGGVAYAARVEGPECAGYASAPFGFSHPATNESLTSGNTCDCPGCGAETRARYSGNIRGSYDIASCLPLTATRIGDKLALIGWYLRKTCDRDANVRYQSHGLEAYVIEPKIIVRLKAYSNVLSSFSLGPWQQMKTFCDNYGGTNLAYPFDPGVLIGSSAENSKLDIFVRDAEKSSVYPITYLRLWQKRPQIENLVTQGASALLNSAIEKNNGEKGLISGLLKSGAIDWKERSPSKMLGMTRDEFRAFAEAEGDVAALAIFREEKKQGRTLSVDGIEEARKLGLPYYRKLRDRGIGLMKAINYLKRQKAKDPRADMGILADYWRIAEMTGQDMALPIILLPPRLMAAHGRAEQARKWQAEAKKETERQARAAQFAQLHEKLGAYSWERDGILILPIKDEAELAEEGEKLEHCVGSYAETHIKGKLPIFAMRRADAPDVPWYTLQLDAESLTVVQNRGLRNCKRTMEVTAFESQWLAHLRELENAPKRRKRAPKSAAVA
jgi:hypothetical protein